MKNQSETPRAVILRQTVNRATAVLMLSMSIGLATTASAQGSWSFDGDWLPNRSIVANVGFQLGWDFADGETIAGLDASLVFHDNIAHGPVFNVVLWRGGSRWQLGYELVTETTIGIVTGPTVAFSGDTDVLGWHMAFFGGAFIVPYYQITMLPGPDAEDAGAYLFKFPFVVDQRRAPEW